MNLLKKNHLLLFIVLSAFMACKSSEKASPSPTPIPEDPIPEMLNGSEPEQAKLQKKILVTINERVRYSFSKVDQNWTGKVIQFSSNDPDTREVERTLEVYPEFGWEDFEDMVSYLKVFNLPDQTVIKNRKPGPITPQSRSYQFTVLENDSTRSYQYYNPEGEASEHWQSQNVVIFGSYLVTEMKVAQEE